MSGTKCFFFLRELESVLVIFLKVRNKLVGGRSMLIPFYLKITLLTDCNNRIMI